MKEFKLQIFIQICCLSKIVLKKGGMKHLNLGYPAQGRASYNHLDCMGIPEERMQQSMDDLGKDLDLRQRWNICMETLLWEAFPHRDHYIFDIYPYRMTLYRLDKNRMCICKPFSKTEWEPLHVSSGT
jgi:hypothetical protein